MGELWWWVRARSPREILEAFANVEVVDYSETVERAATWNLDEADIDAPNLPPGLERRPASQREHSDFGALADRELVHLRRPWDEEDEEHTVYYWEVESDGRRL